MNFSISQSALESIIISTITSTFCMTCGALTAFLLSRYIFRGFFKRQMSKRYPNFHIYEKVIKRDGAKFVLLLPYLLMPFSVLSYLFGGLTQIRISQFTLGIVGIGIPNIFWAYIGSLFGSANEFRDSRKNSKAGWEKIAFMIFGLTVALSGLYIIQKRARAQIKLALSQAEDNSQQSTTKERLIQEQDKQTTLEKVSSL